MLRAPASPCREGDVVVRPVTEADVDLLVAWHLDPDVARFWDGKTFTREEMEERLADDEHSTAWLLMEFDATMLEHDRGAG